MIHAFPQLDFPGGRTAACGLLIASFWSFSAAAAPVEWTADATDLNTPGNWTLHEIVARNPGSTAVLSASGLSSPLSNRIQVNWTVDNATTGRRGEIGLVLNAASWDPATQGEIQRVDFSASQRVRLLTPKSRFLIVQNGEYFIAGTDFHNATRTLTGLVATDFAQIDTRTTGTTGLITIPGSVPDLSAGGAPMQFGLWAFQAASAQVGDSSTECALDYASLEITVHPMGNCLNLFQTVDGSAPPASPRPSPAPGLPNLVIFLADDLGHGDVGFSGHPFIRTPHIDRIADEGARFKNYYAPASICSPSRAAMLTGRMPYRLGQYSFIPDDPDFGYLHLTSTEITFPQLLQQRGYQTALVGKWHVSQPDWHKEEDQPPLEEYGFDYWFSSKNNTVILNKPQWYRNGVSLGMLPGYAANVVGQEALDWLNQHRDPARPFVLFVTFYEPHWRVEGPPDLVNDYTQFYASHAQRAHYPACIENMDNEVGRILDRLDSLFLTDDTLVLFTSDHGPGKFDSGSAYERNDGRSTPYRGQKYGLWDGSVHVPAAMRWPGHIAPGTVVEEPVGSIDLLPTFASIAGARIPTDRPIDGIDFMPALDGVSLPRLIHLQWHHYNSQLHDSSSPQSALRDGDFVLVGFFADPTPSSNGRWQLEHMDRIWNEPLVGFQLYHVSRDPLQQTNLWSSHPLLAEGMRQALVSGHQTVAAEAPGWGHGQDTSSYAAWRATVWSGTDALDDAISGPAADPDEDLWTNLEEYALAMDPLNPINQRAPDYPPMREYVVSGETNRYLTSTFTAPPDAAICYQIGYSNNLAEWSELPAETAIARRRQNADRSRTLTIRDTTPAHQEDSRFLRLHIREP